MDERRFAHRGWGRARLRSFADAFRGLALVFASQANARIHAVATVVVIATGFWLRLSALEWALIVTAIALVWVAEAINTAVECLVDLASPEQHPLAGRAKDAAAGAVLAAAIGAALIGALVFGPKLLAKWEGAQVGRSWRSPIVAARGAPATSTLSFPRPPLQLPHP